MPIAYGAEPFAETRDKQAYIYLGFHPDSTDLKAAAECVAIANRLGESAGGLFKGAIMVARPNDAIDAVVRRWRRAAAPEENARRDTLSGRAPT